MVRKTAYAARCSLVPPLRQPRIAGGTNDDAVIAVCGRISVHFGAADRGDGRPPKGHGSRIPAAMTASPSFDNGFSVPCPGQNSSFGRGKATARVSCHFQFVPDHAMRDRLNGSLAQAPSCLFEHHSTHAMSTSCKGRRPKRRLPAQLLLPPPLHKCWLGGRRSAAQLASMRRNGVWQRVAVRGRTTSHICR